MVSGLAVSAWATIGQIAQIDALQRNTATLDFILETGILSPPSQPASGSTESRR
jgi:hypothetical protein